MPTKGRRARFLRCSDHCATGRKQPRRLKRQPRHRVTELIMRPLQHRFVKMLYRETAIAFDIQPQHAYDLRGQPLDGWRPGRAADRATPQSRYRADGHAIAEMFALTPQASPPASAW